MERSPQIQYFLGANSPKGFYSLYHELIPLDTARAVYLLKGGPGCGKSTLMRRVGAAVEEAGHPAQYILCSGDPDSLDAVIFPTLHIALVDGTAPHVVEPTCPGAVESYLDLGSCYDREALRPLRKELADCMSGYRGCFQRAYRCLWAAAEIRRDMRATLDTPQLQQRLAKRARGIAGRELPRTGGAPGAVTQRFLSGVTHKGVMTLFPTVQAQCQRVYELADTYGTGHTLLTCLLSAASAAGHPVIACPSPMEPDRLEHLLLPDLSLAFVTSTPESPFPARPYRRLRLDAMADAALVRQQRPRLRFARKVSAALVEEAVDSLAQAKAMHDRLEKLYNPHVDFGRVEMLAGQVTAEILALA